MSPSRTDTAASARERPAAANVAVRVDAPARLHLGFVDPSASLGRRYGSLGVAIDSLATVVEVARADEDAFVASDAASAPLVARLRDHVEALRVATGRRTPLRVDLQRSPPAHAGFGSGTQLALAVGLAFARANGIELPTASLAQLLARGARSGVGVAAFERGGVILDGGPGPDGSVAPLLSRLDFPPEWRIVLVLDTRQSGLHGNAEASAIANLPRFTRTAAADIAHEIVMRTLPAIAEHDFEPFAESLTRIQRSIGDYFAPAQGGSMFTSAPVGRLLDWVGRHFRAGVGQSSWGPTGFAFVPSRDVAECVIEQARAAHAASDELRLVICGGRNSGATVTSAAATA